MTACSVPSTTWKPVRVTVQGAPAAVVQPTGSTTPVAAFDGAAVAAKAARPIATTDTTSPSLSFITLPSSWRRQGAFPPQQPSRLLTDESVLPRDPIPKR